MLFESGAREFRHLEDLTMLSPDELNKPWVDKLITQLDVETIGHTL
jgi:hypothetical protein